MYYYCVCDTSVSLIGFYKTVDGELKGYHRHDDNNNLYARVPYDVFQYI